MRSSVNTNRYMRCSANVNKYMRSNFSAYAVVNKFTAALVFVHNSTSGLHIIYFKIEKWISNILDSRSILSTQIFRVFGRFSKILSFWIQSRLIELWNEKARSWLVSNYTFVFFAKYKFKIKLKLQILNFLLFRYSSHQLKVAVRVKYILWP